MAKADKALAMLGAGAGLLFLASKAQARENDGKRYPDDTGSPGGLGSRYFTLPELTVTSANLPNTPTPEQIVRIRAFVRNVLDPLRAKLGKPITVTSGFRTREVLADIYRRLGQQPNYSSDHLYEKDGGAADIKVKGVSSDTLAAFLYHSGIPFDQAIWYDKGRGGHLHIGYKFSPAQNRRQTMRAPQSGGYVAWNPGPSPGPMIVGAEGMKGSPYVSERSAYPIGRLAYAIANRISGGRGVNYNARLKDAHGTPIAFGAFGFSESRLSDLGKAPSDLFTADGAGIPVLQDHLMITHMHDILNRMLRGDLAPSLDVGGRLAIEHWGGPGARLRFERENGADFPLFSGSKITSGALFNQFRGILPKPDAERASGVDAVS